MIIIEILVSLLLISYLVINLYYSIRYYERKRKFPHIVQVREVPKKTCTQTQPFKINDKEEIICNFPCDGKCKFI